MTAVSSALEKKATDLLVLDLREIGGFTDFFVICTGTNPRQNQAISDDIHKQMKDLHGELPLSYEGFSTAEWVLMDYGDFVVHVFLDTTRKFYDLERLWRHAKTVPVPGV